VISGTQLRDSCHAVWEIGLSPLIEFAAAQMRRKQTGKAIVQRRIIDRCTCAWVRSAPRLRCAQNYRGLFSGTLGTSLRSGRRPHNQK